MKTRGELQLEDSATDRPSEAVLAAYHDTGHTIAARAIGNVTTRLPRALVLDDWFAFTAAGHAAERELVSRLGLRWRRVTSQMGHEVQSCYRRFREATGGDPDWIRLHWIRAVRRATRLLSERWGEVVRLAESNLALGSRQRLDLGLCLAPSAGNKNALRKS
jgi:hypothetical protein